MLFSKSRKEHRSHALSKQCLSSEVQRHYEKLCHEQKPPLTKLFCVPIFAGTLRSFFGNRSVNQILAGQHSCRRGCPPVLCQLPTPACQGCSAQRDCKSQGLGNKSAWLRKATPSAVPSIPLMSIRAARTSKFCCKGYILLPHNLPNSWASRQSCALTQRRRQQGASSAPILC